MNSQLFPSPLPLTEPLRRRLVLSVDDEPNILQTRHAILENAGYGVLSASNGEDALKLFDAHPAVELVLLDYLMPGMTGGAVAREIKARRSSVPVIIVSGHEALVSKLGLSCVDLVIGKGIGPDHLLSKINQLLPPAASSLPKLC